MNPLFKCYVSTAGLKEYAKASAIVVTGRGNRYDPAFQDARAAGAIVAQYWMTFECPDDLSNPLDQETYFVDGKPPPLWPYRDASGRPRTNWKGTKLLDIRTTSPYFEQIKRYARAQIASRKFDAFMLDGAGYRLWSTLAAWDTWPKWERDEWTACMLAVCRAVHEIRCELSPAFEIYHNNVWDNYQAPGSEVGMSYANGCVGENWKHDPWHVNYVKRTFAEPFKKRVLIISPTQAIADAWKADPNVTHLTLVDKAAGQSYQSATPPIVGYEDERPPPDPCAQCKQTVRELEEQNATLRWDNQALATKNASLAAANADLSARMAQIHSLSESV
jgi:hypothetical protein